MDLALESLESFGDVDLFWPIKSYEILHISFVGDKDILRRQWPIYISVERLKQSLNWIRWNS